MKFGINNIVIDTLVLCSTQFMKKAFKALVQNTENLKDADRFLFLSIRFFLSRQKCFPHQ